MVLLQSLVVPCDVGSLLWQYLALMLSEAMQPLTLTVSE